MGAPLGYRVDYRNGLHYDLLLFDTREDYCAFLEANKTPDKEEHVRRLGSVALALLPQRLRKRLGTILILKGEAVSVFAHECEHLMQFLIKRRDVTIKHKITNELMEDLSKDEDEVRALVLGELIVAGLAQLPKRSFRLA